MSMTKRSGIPLSDVIQQLSSDIISLGDLKNDNDDDLGTEVTIDWRIHDEEIS